VLDRERILAKIDVLDGYLKELREILPASFDEYKKIEKRRACERLLQVSIECIIDICGLMVTGLRLGLPAEEDDLFEKLEQAGVIGSPMKQSLKKMKGFRNILVHEYGEVDDMIVYEVLQNNLNDFVAFKQEILQAIKVR
jgi:uncharacterized protein YutE (UPF0331/DUF86 family)